MKMLRFMTRNVSSYTKTISGADAIAQQLPQIRGILPGPYHLIHSTARSTINIPPPRTIIEFPTNTFWNALHSPTPLQALMFQLNVVDMERSHKIDTERDTERAVVLYLVHDVCLIIERGLIPHIRDVGVEDFECIGQSTTGTSRPDITFAVKGKTVLILDYKHTNSLRDDDWTKRALVTKGVRSAKKVVRSIRSREWPTALEHNAFILSQQARKYSSYCGLIVITNYQKMMVLDFTPGNPPANDRTNIVRYFWSDGNVLTHKQLLIAAFVYGLRKAGFLGENE